MAAGFLYVAVYGVNVPVEDDWANVITLSKEAAGTLSLSDLFAQHNELRPLFPRLAQIALAKFGGYSPIVQMYVIEAALLATALVFALAMRRTLGRATLPALPLVAYLVFSLRQSGSMLFAFNVTLALRETFGVGAIALLWLSGLTLGQRRVALVAGAVAAATVSTYSSSQGLVVWPAGLVQLLLEGRGRQRTTTIAFWSLVGIGEWALYLHGYRPVLGHPSATYALRHPVQGVEFFVTLFGASLTAEPTRALVYGSILLALAACALILTARRRETQLMSFWIAVLASSVFMVGEVTIGRTGNGVDQALMSKYACFSIVGMVALVALLTRTVRGEGRRIGAGLLAATAVLIVLSVPGTISEGLASGRHLSTVRRRDAYLLYTYRSEPDALLRDVFQPTAAIVRQFAPYLEARQDTVFAAERPPVPPAPPPSPSRLRADPSPSSCTVDTINGDPAGSLPTVSLDHGYVVVFGWCLAPGNAEPAGGVYITLDNRYVPAYYGEVRVDVAAFFHNRGLGSSGFEAAARLTGDTAGVHTLSVVALSPDEKRAYRPNPTVRFRVE